MKTLKIVGIVAVIAIAYFLGTLNAKDTQELQGSQEPKDTQVTQTVQGSQEPKDYEYGGYPEINPENIEMHKRITGATTRLYAEEEVLFDDGHNPIPKIVNSKTGTWTRDDDESLIMELSDVIFTYNNLKVGTEMTFILGGREYRITKHKDIVTKTTDVSIISKVWFCYKGEDPRGCSPANHTF